MKISNKLVWGWGINDVPASSKSIYYLKWYGILERCFSTKYQNAYPTYKDCTIGEEWKYFSAFVRWVDEQPNRNWMNCEPDKDLLVHGNKHYSPNTCVFITKKLNMFLTEKGRGRGKHLLGACWKPKHNGFSAQCCNPFGKTKDDGRWLGVYPTELEAHLVWKAKKHEYACRFAEMQDDPRVAEALRTRYI